MAIISLVLTSLPKTLSFTHYTYLAGLEVAEYLVGISAPDKGLAVAWYLLGISIPDAFGSHWVFAHHHVSITHD